MTCFYFSLALKLCLRVFILPSNFPPVFSTIITGFSMPIMHLRLKLSIIGNGSCWFWWNCQAIPWFKGGGVKKQQHFSFRCSIFFFLFPMSLRFWGSSQPALILPSTIIRKCDPSHFQVSKAWELAWYWIYDSLLYYCIIVLVHSSFHQYKKMWSIPFSGE